ncbi:unnamed protein product [Mytilus coruscus]|uniref:Uncharacterized protein n=1 Tax=Mytilus coruscus TaxID=42192 RepID=A0A6J8CUF0_MYTCO|nr:unnamed protein product [Mytilus coruscus]
MLKTAKRRKDHYTVRLSLNCYKSGDPVWLLNEIRKEGICQKLKPKVYIGPCIILKKMNILNYCIHLDKEEPVKVVNHDKLKPYQGNQNGAPVLSEFTNARINNYHFDAMHIDCNQIFDIKYMYPANCCPHHGLRQRKSIPKYQMFFTGETRAAIKHYASKHFGVDEHMFSWELCNFSTDNKQMMKRHLSFYTPHSKARLFATEQGIYRGSDEAYLKVNPTPQQVDPELHLSKWEQEASVLFWITKRKPKPSAAA